jgi:molybdopterin-guanine dinucleotide biosynthesis protein A
MNVGGDGGFSVHGDDFIAAVLAGGKGERLGTNKALLKIGEGTVMERILRCLTDVFSSILLVVQEDSFEAPSSYADRVSVVVDVVPEKGPLGGIYTALTYSPAPYVFVMACDMPYPSRELVLCLLSKARGREAVVPRRGEYIEPLFAVYARESREKIQPRLESNRLKIHDFLDELDVLYLDEEEISRCDPDFRSFFNVNTPEDLHNARWR